MGRVGGRLRQVPTGSHEFPKQDVEGSSPFTRSPILGVNEAQQGPYFMSIAGIRGHLPATALRPLNQTHAQCKPIKTATFAR